jgi:hypothetical protein
MTQKQYLRLNLVAGLTSVSLGGWLLHLRAHPPAGDAADLIPFISGILSVVVLPAMFFFRKTTAYAYVLTGMTVIIGTITMAHFSIAGFRHTPGFTDIFLRTTFPDIAMLWVKLALAKALFELFRTSQPDDAHFKGKYIRYPNMGWWYVHLGAMSAVYALGNTLWK